MKNLLAVGVSLFVLLGLSFASAFADGQIIGTFDLTEENSGQTFVAAGFQVVIMDAENAEPLFIKPLLTDTNGMFETGQIPSGSYKIHVGGKIIGQNISGGSFVGPDNYNLFDTADVFNIFDGKITELTHTIIGFVTPEPIEMIPTDTDSLLSIHVFDSNTNTGIAGIQVKLLDPERAFLRREQTTDKEGNVSFWNLKGTYFGNGPSKIRLVDPSGIYQPEFYGAGGEDSFAKGAVVNYKPATESEYLSEGLVLQSTPDKIKKMVNRIINLGLDPNVEEVLTLAMKRSLDIIEDENPNNDMAACGALKGFINQLNGRVNSGKLLKVDAYDLEIGATEIFKDLECK